MEYFDDAFHTFLDIDSVIYLAVNGTVTDTDWVTSHYIQTDWLVNRFAL